MDVTKLKYIKFISQENQNESHFSFTLKEINPSGKF